MDTVAGRGGGRPSLQVQEPSMQSLRSAHGEAAFAKSRPRPAPVSTSPLSTFQRGQGRYVEKMHNNLFSLSLYINRL